MGVGVLLLFWSASDPLGSVWGRCPGRHSPVAATYAHVTGISHPVHFVTWSKVSKLVKGFIAAVWLQIKNKLLVSRDARTRDYTTLAAGLEPGFPWVPFLVSLWMTPLLLSPEKSLYLWMRVTAERPEKTELYLDRLESPTSLSSPPVHLLSLSCTSASSGIDHTAPVEASGAGVIWSWKRKWKWSLFVLYWQVPLLKTHV